MKSFLVRRASCLKGEIALLGDKSIAHRCIILGSLAQGKTTFENFPTNKDCFYTVNAFRKLGVNITTKKPSAHSKSTLISVSGKGLRGLSRPKRPVFVGDSGTTLRLLLGVLSGQDFEVKLITGKSLSRRPMLRVTAPLRLMGVKISAERRAQSAERKEEYPPIIIRGANLRAITYRMPVASAQVKSAILLAGLYAGAITRVLEPVPTRDHTERMLKAFGADIKLKANAIVIKGKKGLVSPGKFYIPGDISSASFFIVAAAILPDSELLIKNVGLNPLRTGIIKVLKRMGADIKVRKLQGREVARYEPMGDILVKSSKLNGTIVKDREIPSLIDELPILMVAACFARGSTIFQGAGELRVKETDRIASMSESLKKMGAKIKITKKDKSECIIIEGVKELEGIRVRSFGDHRTAMSMVVAGLRAKGETIIDDVSCINKSFPEFLRIVNKLIVT